MTDPFDRLMQGRVLAGRYEILEPIGRGGMSVVYRGLDRTLGRPVAVKLISLPADTGEVRAHLRERFRREAGAAARIAAHPNVVQVFDYGTDPELDADFIVMELLSGRDLKAALAEGPLPRGEAVRILREAARGLAAGHRAGIVHRDVKPANVFLTGGEELESVRILDFGIAKPLARDPDDDLTLAGQLPHSPAYASPEQLDLERSVTPASDVYQLGLIGYELLAGERPFDPEERERIRAGEEVAPRGGARWEAVPAPLREVVERALRVRPEERHPDAAEFAEALSAAASAEDDHTLLAVPAREEEATLASPPPPPRQYELPQPPPPVAAPRPVRAARQGRGGSGRTVLTALGVALLVFAAVWALSRMGGGGADPEPAAVAAEAPDSAALAGEFESLEGEAAQEQLEELAAEDAGGAGEETPPEELPALQEAAAGVQRAVVALNDTWVAGDMDRHLDLYADRVDFYNQADASRSVVHRERARDLERYDRSRRITIQRQAVTFPGNDPDRARVLVDKEWEFVGEEWRRTGEGRQEIRLERRDGEWKVVAERMLEVRRSNVERV